MASFGKKILSAFVEVSKDSDAGGAGKDPGTSGPRGYDGSSSAGKTGSAGPGSGGAGGGSGRDNRMVEYFDKLFSDANLPGPDYFEFSKMVAALKMVPDEFSRFCAAYAGLQAQGLTREKLLSSAAEYLKVLDADSVRFHSTVEAALQEKVTGKKAEAEEKNIRIQALSKEISELQDQIVALQAEISESEEKITGRSGDYTAECAARQQLIYADIEKVKQYIIPA